MADRHVTALFSEAYDRRLGDAQRRRLDDHLATCDACSTGWSEFQASVDALRALPAVRMPVAVRVPSSPPVAERRALPAWLREVRLLRPPVLASAMGVLATAAAVVVVAVVVGHGRNDASTAVVGTSLQAAGTTDSRAVASAAGGLQQPPAAPAGSLDTVAVSGFVNATVATVPGHPAEHVLVATQRYTYAAGERVDVIVRLYGAAAGTTDGGVNPAGPSMASVYPGVVLTGAGASSGGTPPAGAVTAKTTGEVASDGGPIFSLSLPADLAHGQTVELHALITADNGSDQLVAVLVITVA